MHESTIYLIEEALNNYSDPMKVLKLLTNSNTPKSDPNYNYYKELSNVVKGQGWKTNVNLQKINFSNKTLIRNKKIVDPDIAKDYPHINETKNLGSHLYALDQLRKNQNDPKMLKLIQQTALELLEAVRDMLGEPKKTKVTDWTAEKAKRLSQAKANGQTTSQVIDEFYNDYYAQEYAGVNSPEEDKNGIVDKLNSLNKILVIEFKALGYNPQVNPFAQFLKNLIKYKKSEIFDKLTEKTYGAIHNAFISKYITGNMLGLWNESSESNILFCENLYGYPGVEIVKYLDIQKQLVNAAKEDERFKEDPQALSMKLLIRQEKEEGDTYEAKVNALLNIQKPIKPTDKNAKLRSLSEISELYTFIFKADLKDDNKKENKEKENIINALVTTALSQELLLDMIQSILDENSFKQEYASFVETTTKELTDLGYQRNKQKISTSYSQRELLTNKTKLTNEDLHKLVKKLLTEYKKNKKELKDKK
jgi:hypothetical protein